MLLGLVQSAEGCSMYIGVERMIRAVALNVLLVAINAELFSGYGFELLGMRADLELGGGPRFWRVRYEDATTRTLTGGWVGTAFRMVLGLPRSRPIVLLIGRVGLGLQLAPSVAVTRDDLFASPTAHIEVGLGLPLLFD